MANTTDYSSSLALAVRSVSASVVSTLLQNAPVLQAFHIFSQNKSHDVFDIGNPTTDTLLSGAQLDPVTQRTVMQDSAFYAMVDSILQNDYKRGQYRDTIVGASAHSGTDPTLAATVVNGSITAVTVSGGGTGFSGAAPTIIAVDALGSAGFGAQFEATVSGGAITAVTVINGGQGYASSGVTLIANAGYSAGEKFSRPFWKYSELKNAGWVYDRDVDAAKKLVVDAEKGGEAAVSLIPMEFKRVAALQSQVIANDIWNGTPTSDVADMWDKQYGLLQAVDDGSSTGTYAGIDRTLAANYWFRAVVDTKAHNFTLQQLVDDANLNKGLVTRGKGVDLFVVPLNLLAKFRAESVAYQENANMDDKVRELAQYGFKSNVIKYGNAYCIGDWRCPQKTVLGLNMESFILNFLPGRKFAPSELYDQRGIPGGIEGHRFDVRTQWRLMCVAPNLNIKYTNVS